MQHPSEVKDVWDKTVKVEENGYYHKNEPIYIPGSDLPENKPIVVELFSGCGGTSLGFEMAGFHIAMGCDIHKPSVDTFKANHPSASTINGDIKGVDSKIIAEDLNDRNVDVLIAGVPCQGFSLNNRKRHEKDDRNLLYKEFVRFVKNLKPRVVVLENVGGMKSTGTYVKDIERDLSRAGEMKVASKMLYAEEYGVPQRRSRLVFIGIRGQEFNFDSVIKSHGPETNQEFVTIKNAIGDLPPLLPNEEKNEYRCPPFSEYQKLMRKNAPQCITSHVAPNHPNSTVVRIKNTKPGEPMYPRYKQRIRLAWDILSPTQVSGGIRPQFQFGHPADTRGLSIRERCRLQSFPDSFVIKGGMVQARVQTGNAVPPLLAKALANAIKLYI